MPKVLTPAQIDQFREQGFASPIRVMSAAEALGYRRQLERFERETGGPLSGHLRHKTHLLFTWLADLVRHPRILDAVDDLYGPDLLCWTKFFYQGESKPGLRLLASGFNLLGLKPARCSNGLGRLYPSERRERRDGGNPGQP